MVARPTPPHRYRVVVGHLYEETRDCPVLMPKLAAPDALVRYNVFQAAGILGCIGPESLQSLAERDDNEEIGNLAAALLRERRD
jgi:hypothetical protein